MYERRLGGHGGFRVDISVGYYHTSLSCPFLAHGAMKDHYGLGVP